MCVQQSVAVRLSLVRIPGLFKHLTSISTVWFRVQFPAVQLPYMLCIEKKREWQKEEGRVVGKQTGDWKRMKKSHEMETDIEKGGASEWRNTPRNSAI